MTAVPAVSVVIIFLDAERFLAEAVESVFAQDFADWELLLVDDGSGDRSTALAREYARCDPGRIRYLEHEGHANRGMSAARNLGLAHARGDFVAFLDADDVWTPGKLGAQVALLHSQPRAAMVFGRTRYWHEWKGPCATPDEIARSFERDDVLIRPPHLLARTLLGSGRWPSPSMSSILVRRGAIDRAGGFEEAYEAVGEDSIFLVKLLLRNYVYYSSDCWDWYRQHDDSCTARARREGSPQEWHRRFLEWTREYFCREGVRDPYLLGPVEEGLLLVRRPFLARIRPSFLRRKLVERLREAASRHLSAPARARARHAAARLRRPWLRIVGALRLRSLWSTRPIHREFGCYDGTPVDRVYIEGFLGDHAEDIRGTVLEIGEATYTRRFGGERVERSEVLHAIPGNPEATIVADLTDAPALASASFDCVILTQTLQCIYDYRAALQTVHRILRPGGVLLATFPGVAHQISREERPYWGDYWRWTSMAAERVFGELFGPGEVRVEARGNVLTCIALLHGLVVEEMRPSDFAYDDPDYELSLGVRAVKS